MIKTDDQTEGDTRARLLEAAMDCFSERGYAGTTTRRICERAGVNLALLSYHWGGKGPLWAAVLGRLNERLVAIATEATCSGQAHTDLRDGVSAFLSAVARELLADPRPLRVMAWAQLQPDGFDPAVVEAAYAPAVRGAIAFLQAAQAAGQIPEHVDVPVALLTFYGLLAEPVVEPSVHRALLGADHRDPHHAARIERHLVRAGLALLGLE
jgi:AcrR family transcriptional regulator